MKRKYISNEKGCNSKTLWLRCFKEKEAFTKTSKREEENETIW
jgi:hypothetical protein